MMENTRDLRVLLASRFPLLVAEVPDEVRFMSILRREADVLRLPLWIWTSTTGLRRDGASESAYSTLDPKSALAFIGSLTEPAVFVFADVQHALADPIAVRRIKEVAQSAPKGQTIVLQVPKMEVPPELEDLAVKWRLLLPDTEELSEIVDRNLAEIGARGLPVDLDEIGRQRLVYACQGLSAALAGRLIQEMAFADQRVSSEDIDRVLEGKAELLAAGGVLELVESTAGSLDQVGGMALLKEWLGLRGRAFEPAAREFGLDPPRGVLLTGVPGCGKSLVAKTLARTWNLPLLLLDPARLYGPYVGQSEETLRSSLATVEAMAPVVLWVDEIEKGFAAGGEADSGVSRRILGTFLRWMQDRPPGVFLVATCNEVFTLPPEFLRKGRFDETFFVDLPTAPEREQILRLHLTRRKRDPATFDLAGLAGATEGFSGAELEALVVGAMYRAYGAGQELTDESLRKEAAATSPLSRLRAADVEQVRSWGRDNAVPAA